MSAVAPKPLVTADDRRVFPRPSSFEPVRSRPRHAWAGPTGWTLLVFATLTTVALAALGRVSVAGAALVVVVAAGSTPVLRRLSHTTHLVELEGLLRMGLAVRLLAVLPRFELRQDAADYHAVGRVLADSFRRLDFLVDTGRPVPGTGSVRYATGLVNVVTFDDEFATFVVFALFGFAGIALYLRAFVWALPDINPGRYAVLLVLWPSLAYWPSSTGKEALMTFGLGLAAFGLARTLRGRWVALVPFLGGLLVAGLVRPHVALIAITAAMGAFVLHSRSNQTSGVGARLVVVGALVGVGTILSDAVERLFDVQDLNVTTVSAALDLANHRSAQGNSSFVAARIDSLGDVPWGVITVLLRPLPHEAGSIPGLIAAFEGLVLAALLFGAVPRVAAALRHLRREAYIGYVVGFVGVFVFLFSALGNFGILTRQRTMMTPLLLVLIALPTAYERVRHRRTGRVA